MTNKIKWGAVVWISAVALLTAWSGIAAGRNAAESDRVQDEVAQLVKREHLYLVIAGEMSGNEPGPVNRLGRDLHGTSTEDLSTFEGDSNRYGGISEDLGFDPFDSPTCSECGPLDEDIINDIVLIRESGVAAALLQYQVEEAGTASGTPGFLWIIWFLSYPVFVAVVYIRNKRGEEGKYRDFAQERALIHELREAGPDMLMPAQRDQIGALADQLEAQIETRINYSKSKTTQMKLEQLTAEAVTALEAIAAGNETLD